MAKTRRARRNPIPKTRVLSERVKSLTPRNKPTGRELSNAEILRILKNLKADLDATAQKAGLR